MFRVGFILESPQAWQNLMAWIRQAGERSLPAAAQEERSISDTKDTICAFKYLVNLCSSTGRIPGFSLSGLTSLMGTFSDKSKTWSPLHHNTHLQWLYRLGLFSPRCHGLKLLPYISIPVIPDVCSARKSSWRSWIKNLKAFISLRLEMLLAQLSWRNGAHKHFVIHLLHAFCDN